MLSICDEIKEKEKLRILPGLSVKIFYKQTLYIMLIVDII